MLMVILGAAMQIAAHDVVVTRSYYVRGQRWDFTVTDIELGPAPVWEPAAPFPPLSPRQAIAIAREQLTGLVEDSDYWPFVSVALSPISSGAHWIYIVEYAEPIARDGKRVNVAGAHLGLVILMNGRAIAPVRQRWPQQ